MGTIMPRSELFRRAVEWIIEARRERPSTPLEVIVDEAGMRFNLSPRDCAGLIEFFSNPQP